MPNLIQSLLRRDIGHLRIVGRLWGIELTSPDLDTALKELAAALLDPKNVAEIVGALPAEASSALETLVKADGRLPWAAYSRLYGDIRDAGPGRRDREQMYLDPASVSEVLFYRAFIARAFFDLPSGAQEFAYIPDDLLPMIHLEDHPRDKGENGIKSSILTGFMVNLGDEPHGRPATPKERDHQLQACDRLIDDATTLLAALRMGLNLPETRIPVQVVMAFLTTAKIILPLPGGSGDGFPQIEPVRHFLEASRQEALDGLFAAWQESETFNELHQVPGLVCEGEWSNQPLVTRKFLNQKMDTIPRNRWWSLAAFIRSIKEKYPDFQRPVGDYDSWFVKRESDGTFLRGFTNWDEVDGALIRYLITGPLYWLGQVQLSTPSNSEKISAFLIPSKSENQTSNIRPSSSIDMGKLTVTSTGEIRVFRSVPRSARYQIARFCKWEEEKPEEYCYRVTTGSLEKAGKQGLKVSQLLSLLAKNSAAEIPPAFIKALKRWEINGTEARVETQTILRVSQPDILDELHKSKAGRFLGETLGPVTVVVKAGAQSKVLAALAELGLLAENLASTPDAPEQTDRRGRK